MKIKKLCSNAIIPKYQTKCSAGLDLHSIEDVELIPNERKLIGTGLAMEIPIGFEGQVRPRSGLAVKHGITVLNSPGTIDSDFRGEVKVILINHSDKSFMINEGDRIAQLIISSVKQVEIEEVKELTETERGEGGFGSTGRNN